MNRKHLSPTLILFQQDTPLGSVQQQKIILGRFVETTNICLNGEFSGSEQLGNSSRKRTTPGGIHRLNGGAHNTGNFLQTLLPMPSCRGFK
ncbi:hypothetical protein AMELA_G00151550 [Ameiurus melas]|uniref:Uncharacterized protein n=1 Tax=Ameiurus melas TaxID=219545 RepID=A0A7J6AHJ7_AMEME|nr:hypothetical protein AMELA_G00151550 [Ameiurus melas]